MAENLENKVTEGEEVKPAKKVASKKAPAKKTAAKKTTTKKAASKKAETATAEETKPVETKPVVTEARAELNNFGVTPRKVRLVINLVRGKDLDEAYAILDNCPKACAKAIKKLIQSAAANAENNFKMDPNTLYVASITANDAMRLKRILPRAKGSASGLIKRWSHVYVTVKNREAK